MTERHIFVPALPTSNGVSCRHTAVENDAILYVADKRGFHSENCTANSTGIWLSKVIDVLGNGNHQGFKTCVLWFLCYEVLPYLKYQKPTYYVSQYYSGTQPKFTDTVGKSLRAQDQFARSQTCLGTGEVEAIKSGALCTHLKCPRSSMPNTKFAVAQTEDCRTSQESVLDLPSLLHVLFPLPSHIISVLFLFFF